MRAMQLSSSENPPSLREADVPQPTPAANEVLVRVHAAGVTTTELGWYPNTHTKSGAPRTGAIPGHEFSGVVAAVGDHVKDFTVGQEIYGMNDWFAEGALAEYCIALPLGIAPKPATLSHIEAAGVPIPALTAWQGLFDRAKMQAGERVLVHGAAGAVGVFAVQLAHMRGAHVIATAAPRNRDFVLKLGAKEVIDYTSQRFESVARDIDIVFEVLGGDTLHRSWQVLNPTGRLVEISSSVEDEAKTDPRIAKAFFIVEPNHQQFVDVAKLIDAGKLKVFVDAVVPLSEAASAYSGQIKHRQGHGKIVVSVASANANATASA
ncbi:MAG: NADP-dependent oxidoreductase [Candidatus Acidiferrum sp.]